MADSISVEKDNSDLVSRAIEQGQPSDNTRSKRSSLFPPLDTEREAFKSRSKVQRSPVVAPYSRPLVIRSEDGIRVITKSPSGIEVRNIHQGIRPPTPRTNPLVPPPHTTSTSLTPRPSKETLLTPDAASSNPRPRLPTPRDQQALTETPYRRRANTGTPTGISGIDSLQTPGGLDWDNQYDYAQILEEDTRDTSAHLGHTNMSAEDTKAANHKANLHLTTLTYEEYEGYTLAAYPVEVLQQAIKEIHDVTLNYRHAKAYYLSITPDEDTAQLITQANAAAASLRTLQHSISQHIVERTAKSLAENLTLRKEPPAAPSVASTTGSSGRPMTDTMRDIKTRRIQGMKEEVVIEAADMEVELMKIVNTIPSDDSQLLTMRTSFERLEAGASKIIKKLGIHCDDAADLDLLDDAREIDDALTSLDRILSQAKKSVEHESERFGYRTESTTTRSKAENLILPTFSGKEGEDFYKFKKEYGLYAGSLMNVTHDDRLNLLKKRCLKDQAAVICAHETNVEEIWRRLSARYGNIPRILQRKRTEILKLSRCPWKTADRAKQLDWLINLRMKIVEIVNFVTENKVTSELYHKGDIHVIANQLLDDRRGEQLTRKYKESTDSNGIVDTEKCFRHLEKFLDEEIELVTFELSIRTTEPSHATDATRTQKAQHNPDKRGQTVLTADVVTEDESEHAYPGDNLQEGRQKRATGDKPPTPKLEQAGPGSTPKLVRCENCTEQHTHLFYCKHFQSSEVKERIKIATASGCCFRCLRMDSEVDLSDLNGWWETHKNDCRTDHFCNVGGCSRVTHRRQKHILCCIYHTKINAKRLNHFKQTMDADKIPSVELLFVGDYIQTAHQLPERIDTSQDTLPDITSPSIFMCQEVPSPDGGPPLLVFYDSGCGSCCISTRAANALNSKTLREGPTVLNVAGGRSVEIPYGIEQFIMNLADNNARATLSGIQMDNPTAPFPTWKLQQAYNEFSKAQGSDTSSLPTVPDKVGGSCVDIIVGIKYNTLFPKLIMQLPCGLALYESKFTGVGGHRGILGGPHEAWAEVHATTSFMSAANYFTNELKAAAYQRKSLFDMLDWSVASIDSASDTDELETYQVYQSSTKHVRRLEKEYFDSERIGSEASYRCADCRGCNKCRQGPKYEHQSLIEEAEDALIAKSVEFDMEHKCLWAELPFTADPEKELGKNRHVALAVLKGQMKQLRGSEVKRQEVLKSHAKLVDNGYSCRVDELPEDMQQQLAEATGSYYLPWRTVHKEGSLSTPVRTVFDASSTTTSGKSLNNILAKGSNKLETIFNLLTNFRAGKHAFLFDIRMAYNQLKLRPKSLTWHRYLWIPDLNPENEVEERVMLTIIYGVISSGGQTAEGMHRIADYGRKHFPEHTAGADVLENLLYVDDGSDSQDSEEERRKTIDSIHFLLDQANIETKAFVLSGEKPHESVSVDEKHVTVLGYQWDPEEDLLSLDPKPLFFGKRRRGKNPELVTGDLREALMANFTKRILLSRMASCYDPLGLVSPITGQFKKDYHEIVRLGTDWDDLLPEAHLDRWKQNIEVMQRLPEVKFHRSVAETSEVNLIVSVDASKDLAVACVHVQETLPTGEVKVRLAAAKSRLVTGSSIPRAELKACTMGATLARVVTNNLKGKVKDTWFVSDSTIALSWINSDTRPMTIGVRNNVIEILRFTDRSQWFHVDGTNNIADLGTRDGVKLSDIDQDSDWQIGKPWMRLDRSQMPIRPVKEMQLSKEDKDEVNKEIKVISAVVCNIQELQTRYKYSQYLLDPNQYGWRKTLRILAYMRRFIFWRIANKRKVELSTLIPSISTESDALSMEELTVIERYYFRCGTKEVEKFYKGKELQHVIDRDGILHYTGRFLDGEEIDDPENVFPDLKPLTFVKPVLDRYSPIAYAIMIYVHHKVLHHKGVPQMVLESRYIAYIIGARALAKEVRADCTACKRRKARLLEAEMAPRHESRTCVAPAFYHTQLDLCGPFTAICEHNHRSTVKVWCAVFRCPTTSATAAHAMSSYSTEAFLGAFQRFVTYHAVPHIVYIDPGSQLVKACKDMQLSMGDITSTLSGQYLAGIRHKVAPAAGHNWQGVVERSIQEIKRLFHATFDGLRLDILNYETSFAWCCMQLNNLPLCIGSRTDDLEHVDLITPSRLMLGRASNRALVEPCTVEKPTRMLQQMNQLYESWWKVWLNEKLADFIPRSSLFSRTSRQPMLNDVVIFTRTPDEKFIGDSTFKLGIVSDVFPSKDGIIRSVEITYRNASEKVSRTTRRSVRHIATILPEDDLCLAESLAKAADDAHHMGYYKDVAPRPPSMEQ